MAQAERSMNLVTLQDTAIAPLLSDQAQKTLALRMERFEHHHPLEVKRTPQDLLVDLAWQMTEKPKLKRCSPESLFKCLLFAADTGSALGPYGVHLVPRALKDEDSEDQSKVLTAMPVLSANRKEQILIDWYGYDHLEIHYVFKSDTFSVIRDNGVIVGVEHSQNDMAPRPALEEMVRVYSVAIHPDGRRRYHISYIEDIWDRRNKSSSKNKQGQIIGPWKDNTLSMIRKTQGHIATDDIVGDFSAGAMQIAGANLPEGSLIEHRDFTDAETQATEEETLAEQKGSRTAALGEQLDRMAAEPVRSQPAAQATPTQPTPSQAKSVGYTPEQMTAWKNQIADQGLKGEKALVDWCKVKYLAWTDEATKDQVNELIAERDLIIKQIRATPKS